jgi:hypothetical protein
LALSHQSKRRSSKVVNQEIPMAVDWRSLAIEVGALAEKPGGANLECGSSRMAQQAIETLIGVENLQSAVDYYISGQPGGELARHILWQLHPWSAMQHCYNIYKSSCDNDARITAVELLRVVADARALTWVSEFLADPEPGIQFWGIGIVDQLLFSRLIEPEDAADIISQAVFHPNPDVAQKARDMQSIFEE